MSLFTQSNFIQYQGDGTTVTFPFPNLTYQASDIQVFGLDTTTGILTTYALTTDYTIDPSELGQPSGLDVVFNTAPASGIIVSIYRIVPYVQPTVLPSGTPLPGPTIEKRIDNVVMMCQQLQQQVAVPYLPGQIPKTSYTPYDLSSNGIPQIGVTPGNTRDATGGTIVVPKINNVPLTNSPPPILVLGSSNLYVLIRYPVDPLTGELDQDNSDIIGSDTLLDDTASFAYQLLCNCVVNNPGTNTNVTFSDIIGKSQNYLYCGILPAIDGSGHTFNS